MNMPSDARLAYASQDAFIVIGTCRENILFGQPYNREWYDTVVGACALTMDFAGLPFGDQTKLGDKGSSLSGGQRQRLVRLFFFKLFVTQTCTQAWDGMG